MGRNNRSKGKKKKRGGGGGGRSNTCSNEDERKETDALIKEEYAQFLEYIDSIDINVPPPYAIGTRVNCPSLYNMSWADKSIFPWSTGTVVEHWVRQDDWPEGLYQPYRVKMDGTNGASFLKPEDFFEKLDEPPMKIVFKAGNRVECQLEESGRWFPGVVIQSANDKNKWFRTDTSPYFIRFDYGRECHFYGPPFAIRACNLPLPKNQRKMELRFKVGDRVECSLPSGYFPGTIIQTWYRGEGESIFEDGHKVPYQIQLDMGDKIYAPLDNDLCIRKSSIPPPDCCICFDNEQTEDNIIVHECACRGSQSGFAHIGCRVKWAKSKMDIDIEPDGDYDFLRCDTCRQCFAIGSRCHAALTRMLFNETKHIDINNRWSKIAITTMSQVLDYEEKYDAAELLLQERIAKIRSRMNDEEKSDGEADLTLLIDLSNFLHDLSLVYSNQQSFDEMKEVIEEALLYIDIVVDDDRFHEIGDSYDAKRQKAEMIGVLGKHAYQTGDYKSGLEYCEKAISLAKTCNEGLAEGLMWLTGELNIIAGNRQRGTELLQELVDHDTKIYGSDSLTTRKSRERMHNLLQLT